MSEKVIKCDAEVAILMSTFNGCAYLGEQLDSLIAQTFTGWNLFVRDDGSKDNTKEIIERYAAKDSRIHYYHDAVAHRGVKGSFTELLRGVEAQYYMFCDQDDVWLPKKVQRSMQAMAEAEGTADNIPILITSDLTLVDEKLNITHKSMWQTLGIEQIAAKPDYICIAPMYSGCTMLFNAAAKESALHGKDSAKIIHDQLVALNVKRSGGIITPIPEPLILYRQHSANEVGARSTHSGRNPVAIVRGVVTESLNYYHIVNDILGVSAGEYFIKKMRRIFKMA